MSEKAEPARKEPFNPAKFTREVRQEMKKVSWPTRRETMISTAMVLLLASFAAVFFLLADNLIAWIVEVILGIAS